MSGGRQFLAPIAVLGVVAALSAMAALLFATPDGFMGVMGIGREGADVFGTTLMGRAVTPVTIPEFVWGFRTVLLAAWAAWLATVVVAHRGLSSSWIRLSVLTGGLAVVLAFVMPPVLSRDAFGYVAYGNLVARGLNPYVHGTHAGLEALGDPLARFMVRDTSLGYGPLWTLLAPALNFVGSACGLYGQAVAHKLAAALALIAVAFGASRLAEFSTSSLAKPTFVAVMLNPLLLVEGPGMGHNDLLMLALLVWSAVFGARSRWRVAALTIGLACAIKPVAVTAVPLIAFAAWASKRPAMDWRDLPILATLVLAPFVGLSLLFGGPILVLRAIAGQANPGAGRLVFAVAVSLAMVWSLWTVWRQRESATPVWLLTWTAVAAALILFGTQYRFPWYATWLLVPALTGWDERHRITITVASTVAILLSWLYTVG
jgi:hypothetical protein